MPLSEEDKKTLKVIGIVAIAFSTLFIVVIMIYFQNPVNVYCEYCRKPNVYLYSNEEIEETLRIDVIDGRVIKSDPLVHKSNYVEWNVTVNASGLYYEDTQIPWLFYETEMESPIEETNYGWYIEKNGDTIRFHNTLYSSSEFPTIFLNELQRIGLFEKEAQDFIDYWFSHENALLQGDGKYLLRLANSDWINSHLVISTLHKYEILRIFLVLDRVVAPVTLSPIPDALPVQSSRILHEWGVIIH